MGAIFKTNFQNDKANMMGDFLFGEKWSGEHNGFFLFHTEGVDGELCKRKRKRKRNMQGTIEGLFCLLAMTIF